ncbi:hypothetical protein BDZ94DRAFT_1255258 [Collybia nuda]|uniref:Uncharacterized protein n=1 Tax=Collybia nuda TaxID=64659 RepID=A0A9P6CGI0_9AGAR|nr:hypothetical protein BDZ94DRAFT_1255258 [Collybia nuda]
MAFSYRDLFCGGKTFCCCLPVRMGVVIMSLLGILFGGTLSIVLWYEVASTPDMTSGERAGFVIAGLVESFLLAASVLGLVGAIVRKQTFVQAYAYFIYVHFLLNVAVAGFLLYMVTHFTANAQVAACQKSIQNQEGKEQCTGLLKIAQGVYFVVAAVVLLIELYGALVVTRYVNQVKKEKRSARKSRLDSEEAFRLVPNKTGKVGYFAIPSPGLYPSYPQNSTREFDPYTEVANPNYITGPSNVYDINPPPPVEVGYGGGLWTHEDISEEEKSRVKRMDADLEVEHAAEVSDEEMDRRRRDIKSLNDPPVRPRVTEDLPRYTLSDPPRAG